MRWQTVKIEHASANDRKGKGKGKEQHPEKQSFTGCDNVFADPGGVKTRIFPATVLGGVKTWSFDEGPSIGGGRGVFNKSHGDYPNGGTTECYCKSRRRKNWEFGEFCRETH